MTINPFPFFHALPKMALCMAFNSLILNSKHLCNDLSGNYQMLAGKDPSLLPCLYDYDLTRTKTNFVDLGNLMWLEPGQEGHIKSSFSNCWVLGPNHVDFVPLPYILGFEKI